MQIMSKTLTLSLTVNMCKLANFETDFGASKETSLKNRGKVLLDCPVIREPGVIKALWETLHRN